MCPQYMNAFPMSLCGPVLVHVCLCIKFRNSIHTEIPFRNTLTCRFFEL